jgi:uncharacterized protein (TIGR00730 family)
MVVRRMPSLVRALNTICVFCGSSHGLKPSYRAAAAELGELLAAGGLTLVYGGGCVGLMGTVADAALSTGGEVIGVIPQALVAKELSHAGLTKLHVVNSMHERKALMASLSDAFIALPGGFGTAEELCEILTWGQLGIHSKPVGLLNVDGFFDSLLEWLDHATQEGFIRMEHRQLLLTDTNPSRLLARMSAYEVPPVEKWLDRAKS